MLCGQSEPRSFRMMTVLIIWMHLIISIILILGISLEDTKVETVGSNGVIRFYVLCFSILSILPQLLALYGVNKKVPLFMTPYIITLMTMVCLLVLVVVIIILGMVFDPEHLLNEWGSLRASHCEILRELWLTILGMSLVIVILSICLFVILSYYKILLKQEEMNRLRYIETYNPNQQTISAPIVPQPRTLRTSDPPPPSMPSTSQSSPPNTEEDSAPKEEEEEPPPSYSRAQSIIGQSYV